MPSRNILKDYLPESYYHVYNRGVAKQHIFLDDFDYQKFTSILKRHLDDKIILNTEGIPYAKYKEVNLLAYCLMPNHFHMLLYIEENPREMIDLLRSASTAYSMYFNKRYKRVGPLFQSRYKAVRIVDDKHLYHISRYIHLNPINYMTWQWSSLQHYLTDYPENWINTQIITNMLKPTTYADYIKEH